MKHDLNMPQKYAKPWFDPPTPLEDGSNIAVIGGGISGLLIASHLSSHFTVTIIDEKEKLMHGASGNPAAILDPYLSLSETIEKDFYLKAYQYAIDYYSALKSSAFHQCGLMKIAKDHNELKKFTKLTPHYPPSILSQTEDGLFFPKSGYIIPSQLIKALSAKFKTLLNCKITRLEKNDTQKWSLINEQDHNIINVDAVIICNSYDVHHFEQTRTLALQKMSGQISYLAPQIKDKKIYCSNGYLSPPVHTKFGTAHICGATFDREKHIEISDDAHLLNIQKSPRAFSNPIILGGRRAIRAMTHDHLPLCGPLPNITKYEKLYADLNHGPTHIDFPSAPYHQGLYICAGLGARGFLAAPLLASFLTALMRGEKAPFSKPVAQALHPSRFIIRKLSKK